MNILFCGDKHLKISKFDLSLKFLNWLNQTIEDHKPDLYVCLGDDLDTHSVVRSEILTELRRHFDHVLELGVPIVYVVGNHDCYKPNDIKYHALQSMIGLHPNLYIVDKVQDIFNITFVPYIHDPNQFPKRTLPICVAHQTFKGADFGNVAAKEGVDQDGIDQCELVVSGHIHKTQTLSPGRVQVFYPGSPFSQSASDIDQVKGVYIFDTDTYNFKLIECPLPKWKRISVEIHTDSDIDEFIKCHLEPIMGSKDHYVLELTGSKSTIIRLMSMPLYKQALKNLSVSVKTSFTDKEKKQTTISSSFSIDKMIENYVDSIYSGAVDKQQLKIKALELLKQSNSSL
jgi:DNA repair exonuclease SbcCD nuclease subunit